MSPSNSSDLLATVALHSKHLRNSSSLSNSLKASYQALHGGNDALKLDASRAVLTELGFRPAYVAAFDQGKLESAKVYALNTPGFNDGEEGAYSSTHCERMLREMLRFV